MVDDRGRPRHLVYGLRLSDGGVLPGFPVDVAAGLATRGIRFDPAAQNQRGALALLNGRIYVSFGGHFGDCSDYHGVVVGVGIDPPQLMGAWVASGAIKSHETVVHGLEAMPHAFLGLFEGTNTGKMLVKL